MTESDLLVVKLPEPPNPLLKICKALLAAEISIHYAYPLLVGPQGSAALALHVEDLEAAVHDAVAPGVHPVHGERFRGRGRRPGMNDAMMNDE